MERGLRGLGSKSSGIEWPVPPVVPKKASRQQEWRFRIFLLLTDLLLVIPAFMLAHWMRYWADWPPLLDNLVQPVNEAYFVEFSAFWRITIGLMVLLGVLFSMKGLYSLPRSAGLLDYAGIIFSSTMTGISILIVVVTLIGSSLNSRLIFVFVGFNIVVFLCTWRIIIMIVRQWRWSKGIGLERVLVVGGRGLGQHVMAGIAAQPHLGYKLMGYLDNETCSNGLVPPPVATPTPPAPNGGRFRKLGPIEDLPKIVNEQGIDTVVVALPFWEHGKLPILAQQCSELGVEYRIAPDLYQLSFDRVNVLDISGVPLIELKDVSLKGWNLAFKRAMDLTLVILAAPILIPIGLLIALLVRLDSEGPPVFTQTRVGKNGKLFKIYKFRTMVVDAEARKAELSAFNEADGPIFKMKNDPRITRVGRILRRTSLDELPNFWNVLLGDISLVGPRPAVPSEVAQYEPWHMRRLEVMPGITGLWQVLGRSDTSWEEMVRLDIYYAENWSPGMDIRILLQTIPAVLQGRGAY